MNKPLAGKVAIVTGASRGIGRGIAVRLAADGARVVLAARSEDELTSAVAEIGSAGGDAARIPLDLREEEAGLRLVTFATETYGPVDIVVNNAGATKRGEFLELTDADFADGFALKFFGSVRLTRAAWPHLKESHGSVVFISGVGGRTPGAQFTIGGSVNAAMLTFAKAIAELGIKDRVQVNTINPGTIRTGRFTGRLEALAANKGIPIGDAEATFVEEHQVTRIGEPADIAALVAFVVGPEGRFLQGAMIDMDGGATKTL